MKNSLIACLGCIFFLFSVQPAVCKGRRPQMVADSIRISSWIGTCARRLSEKSSDGVTATQFRKVEITNGDSIWLIKVDCTQQTRRVSDVIGRHVDDQPYDVPSPRGFFIRIERKYSEHRPEPASDPWKHRGDGTAERQIILVPEVSPGMWLTVYAQRGALVTHKNAEFLDELLQGLGDLFRDAKTEP